MLATNLFRLISEFTAICCFLCYPCRMVRYMKYHCRWVKERLEREREMNLNFLMRWGFCFVKLFLCLVSGSIWNLRCEREILVFHYNKVLFSVVAELKVKHQHHPHVYNHTLATILVEYASAVSFVSPLVMLMLNASIVWFRTHGNLYPNFFDTQISMI